MSFPVVWLYGLPNAGKTTLGAALCDLVPHVVHLDADVARRTISKGLGFSTNDRHEHLRRLAETAAMVSNDKPVVVSAVTPTAAMREAVRSILGKAVVLVLVDTPHEDCEHRLGRSIEFMGWDPSGYDLKVSGREATKASALANALALVKLLR